MQHCRSLLQTLLILIIGIAANPATAANQLAGHPSPYLALHAGSIMPGAVTG
jgi:hypothetical protein